MTTTRERAPTVREADLQTMRHVIKRYAANWGLGWEDLWVECWHNLPPSISREDVRRFVIPRLAK